MKKLLLWGLPLLCLAAGCREQTDETPDERSTAYNDRAIALMQDYLERDDILPDSSLLAACRTRTDTIQRVMKDIVDSCQILLDSALLYSPEHYFYYAQKATLYACGAYYQEAARWMEKALEKKDLPELRLGAGMFLQKAGEERQAQTCYRQVADQYRTRDTLSSADRINYAFALILSGEKETARRTIDSLITDTLARKQLLQMTENPQEALEGLFP